MTDPCNLSVRRLAGLTRLPHWRVAQILVGEPSRFTDRAAVRAAIEALELEVPQVLRTPQLDAAMIAGEERVAGLLKFEAHLGHPRPRSARSLAMLRSAAARHGAADVFEDGTDISLDDADRLAGGMW